MAAGHAPNRAGPGPPGAIVHRQPGGILAGTKVLARSIYGTWYAVASSRTTPRMETA